MIINPYPICALALKTLTRYLFYVFHYLRKVVILICIYLRTFYSNEMYNNEALYTVFHLYVK